MKEKSGNADKTTVEERRDAGIARMLNSPPKPHKDMKQGKAKPGRNPDKKRKPKS
jgi:hypothetical protein